VDQTSLALVVDAEIYRPPADRGVAARLYGVVTDVATGAPRIRLLEIGDGKQILRRIRLPRGLDAIALGVAGWRAPLEDDGSITARPSDHPLRQRIHSTSLVAGDGDLVTVLRTASDEPEGHVEVMEGGVGIVPDLLRACWRRAKQREAGVRDADGVPWATS
jgi:hypothetical protein